MTMLKRPVSSRSGGSRPHRAAASTRRTAYPITSQGKGSSAPRAAQSGASSPEVVVDSLTAKLVKNERFADHLFYHPRKLVFDEYDALCRDLNGPVLTTNADFNSVIRVREAGARLRVMLRRVAAILSGDAAYVVRDDLSYETGLLPVLADCALVSVRALSSSQLSQLRANVRESGVRSLADPLARILQGSNISFVKLSTCIMLLGQLSKQLPNYFEVLRRCASDIRSGDASPSQVYFSALVIGDAIAGADGMRLAGRAIGDLEQFVGAERPQHLRQSRADYIKAVASGLATLLGFSQLEDLLEMLSTLSSLLRSQQSTDSLHEDADWYSDILSSIQ